MTKRKSVTKKWRDISPKTQKQRSRVFEKCGKKCFLKPDLKTPGKSKIPICTVNSCKVNCKGLQAAHSRARQWRRGVISKKAKSLQKSKCNLQDCL